MRTSWAAASSQRKTDSIRRRAAAPIRSARPGVPRMSAMASALAGGLHRERPGAVHRRNHAHFRRGGNKPLVKAL